MQVHGPPLVLAHSALSNVQAMAIDTAKRWVFVGTTQEVLRVGYPKAHKPAVEKRAHSGEVQALAIDAAFVYAACQGANGGYELRRLHKRTLNLHGKHRFRSSQNVS